MSQRRIFSERVLRASARRYLINAKVLGELGTFGPQDLAVTVELTEELGCLVRSCHDETGEMRYSFVRGEYPAIFEAEGVAESPPA